jgi:Arc/MetJ family transcription regulator
MRINIEIDERLLREAMRIGGKRTKKAAIEAGLNLLVGVQAQTGIRRLRGRIHWQGDLKRSRTGRNVD